MHSVQVHEIRNFWMFEANQSDRLWSSRLKEFQEARLWHSWDWGGGREDINDRVQEECQRQRTYHSLLSQLREMFVKYQQLCWRQCQLPFAVFEWHWRAWQLQRMIEKVSWYTLTIQNVTVGSPPTSTSCNLSQLLLIVHGGIIWYNSVLWCQSLLFSSQNFSCLIL